ncbi:MAG: DnaJ domain-containing protein, partial [Anaerolineales bacterium]|nr:DnaJ domain-containing protein [Anaerolineales bacterium]
TNKEEIKKAYHRLAFSSHPDRNPDTPDTGNEFDETTKAYRILLEYCQGDSCSFNEEEFKKNSILVKVKE